MTILINNLKRHNDLIQAELNAAVLRVATSGWYILGPEVERFEQEFAAYCGVSHCVAVANGTDALELALRTLDVTIDSEVITVANAGMYGTAAILAIGAKPVFVDVDPQSLTMDSGALRAAIGPRTAAVIVTHLYGQMADLSELLAVTEASGIPLIEDCAQAHGACRQNQRAGSWGALGCFSFYPTKNLGALGDAGAVTTADPQLAAKLRQLRQYGWGQKYCATVAGGRNSRLDELQAAVLRVKLPHLDAWNQRRRTIAQTYAAQIQHPALRLPAFGNDSVTHLYVVRTTHRDALREHLENQGIASDIHYPIPDYRQPALQGRFSDLFLPQTEAAVAEVLTLPCFPEMTDHEITLISNAINLWKI